jgi:hypothetical protein
MRNRIHLTIRGGYDDNGTIHVSSTSNHVLDVIGVTGTVNMGIVSLVGRVLDVGGRNGDTTFPFLRSLVDSAILQEVGKALFSLALGNCSRQRSLMNRVRGWTTEGG